MTRTILRAAPVVVACALAQAPARAQTLEPPPPLPPAQTPAPLPPPPGTRPSTQPATMQPATMQPATMQPATMQPPTLPSTPVLPSSTPLPPPSDESQDSGLGLEWVWANADIGAAYVNLQSFDATNLALQKTETSGPVYGVAAGVRLLFLSIGVRAEDLELASVGSLWELSAEAALHTRVGHVDPYIGVRGGYNFVGTLNSNSVQVAGGDTPPEVSVHGFDVGPTLGIDFYLVKYVSLGLDVYAQFLFLQRPKPPLPDGITESSLPPQYQQLYDNSGSSIGFGLTGTAHLALHL